MYEPDPVTTAPTPTAPDQQSSRVVVREVVRQVPLPDTVWPKAALACAAAGVGMFFGSILVHNHQVGSVITAIIMLVVSSLFALSRIPGAGT